MNVCTPSEEKSDDSKGSYYEELEQVFGHFPQYHIKILLVDFNTKLGRESIFKPTTGNERPHQNSNGNGVRIVNLTTSKNLVLRAQCFCSKTSINTPGPLPMGILTRLITYEVC